VCSVQQPYRRVCLLYCVQCSTSVSECVSTVLWQVFNAAIGVCVYCFECSVQRRYRSVSPVLCAVFNAGIGVCLLSCALCSSPVSRCDFALRAVLNAGIRVSALCAVFNPGIGMSVYGPVISVQRLYRSVLYFDYSLDL
jgi:hypothetical protein